MPTDTSERGLEDLIVAAMAGAAPHAPARDDKVSGPTALYGGTGWQLGNARDYDREHAVDLAQLAAFLTATQPDAATRPDPAADSPARRTFLARLKQYSDNTAFRLWLADAVFGLTYAPPPAPLPPA